MALRVAVDAVTCKTSADFVGLNYEPFESWGADVSLSPFQATAFREAGIRLLRYPGGTPGDWIDLLSNERCKDGSPANWGAPSLHSLWTFAKTAGVGSLLLQTNPTPQWCGATPRDPSGRQAGLLAEAARARGIDAVFEVGNEPDLNEGYFAENGGFEAYTARFVEHARAIHAALPGAEVYGPALCGLGGNCTFPTTWDSGYLDKFLAQTGDKAAGPGRGSVDGVSFHVYWHNEWGYSDLKEAKIDKYGFALYWANTLMPHVRRIIRKHDSRPLPVVVSEISIGNGVPNDKDQIQNMFSVLGTLDVIGAFAASGVRSFQWFDANAGGPMDFWLITKDRARPIFYAFAAWARMGSLVLDVESSVHHRDVASYATKKPDGSVQVLIINKTSSPHPVEVSFDGFDATDKSVQIVSVAPADGGGEASRSVLFNQQRDPRPGELAAPARHINAGAFVSHRLPAHSAAVLLIGP